MAMYINKSDNFVWLDVTDRIKDAFEVGDYSQFDLLWNAHELYFLYPDDTEAVIQSKDEVAPALTNGVRIGIEVGHIPKTGDIGQATHIEDIWSDAQKIHISLFKDNKSNGIFGVDASFIDYFEDDKIILREPFNGTLVELIWSAT